MKCAGDRCGFSKSSYNILYTVRRRDTSVRHNIIESDRSRRNTNSRKVVFNCTYSRASRCVPINVRLTRVLVRRLTHVHRRNGRVACLHPSNGKRIAIRCDSTNLPRQVRAVIIDTRRSRFIATSSVSTARTSRHVQRRVRRSIHAVLLPEIQSHYSRGMLSLFSSSLILLIGPAKGFIVNNPSNSAKLAKEGVVISACNNHKTRNNNTFSNGSPSGISHSTTCVTQCVTGGYITTNITGRVLIRLTCTVNITRPIDICIGACKSTRITEASNRVTTILSRLFSLHPGTVRQRLGLHRPVCHRATTCNRVNHRDAAIIGAFGDVCCSPHAIAIRLFA